MSVQWVESVRDGGEVVVSGVKVSSEGVVEERRYSFVFCLVWKGRNMLCTREGFSRGWEEVSGVGVFKRQLSNVIRSSRVFFMCWSEAGIRIVWDMIGA